MNNFQKTIIFFGAVAIVIVLIMSGFFNPMIVPQSDTYGTGLSINTATVYHTQTKQEQFQKGGTWLTVPDTTVAGLPTNREILYKNKYIVSWMPNEMSELITLRADFKYDSLPMGAGAFDAYGHYETALLSSYFVKVTYVDISGKETIIIDTKSGINGKTELWDSNYVEMVKERFPSDSMHISGLGYKFPGANYEKAPGFSALLGSIGIDRDSTVNSMTFANSHHTSGWFIIGQNPTGDWWKHSKMIVPTDTFEFYMRGLRTGALKVQYGVAYAYLQQDPGFGQIDHGTWHLRVIDNVVEDACYLASGGGDINILSTSYIPGSPLQEPEQKEMMDSTGQTTWGNWYTKFVFEEGTKIAISVKTGYSGTSLNPGDEGYGDPWTLAIYNSKGTQISEMKMPDNFNGVQSYTIPAGSFIPNGNNEWRVVLKNTLFDQAETVLFVISKGALSKIPGPVSVTLDKQSYEEGDDVIMTLSAMANPSGTKEITSFWVDVKYYYGASSTTSTIYHVTGFPKLLHAEKKAGTNYTYTATYKFPLENSRPVTLDKLYFRVHAIDKGGQAGVEGEVVGVYVKQKIPTAFGEGLLQNVDDNLLLLIIIIIIVVVVIILLYVLNKQGKINLKIFSKKKFGDNKKRR